MPLTHPLPFSIIMALVQHTSLSHREQLKLNSGHKYNIIPNKWRIRILNTYGSFTKSDHIQE